MAEKRIIVDHQHALRQHKAFAFMVIVSLLVVLAVWFVQVKLMVRTVDFTKLQQSVADAQAVFGSEEVKSEKEKRPEGVPSEVEGAQTKDGTEAEDLSQPSVDAASESAVRAEVAARAAATLEDGGTATSETTSTP
ncbi:MAG: hypothetical protein AAB663_00490 [Patescibacteria group bacterium]